VIKPAYSVSFLLSINIFAWQNVLYFPNDSRIYTLLLASNGVVPSIYGLTSDPTKLASPVDINPSNSDVFAIFIDLANGIQYKNPDKKH
jgi:hypothetical protein